MTTRIGCAALMGMLCLAPSGHAAQQPGAWETDSLTYDQALVVPQVLHIAAGTIVTVQTRDFLSSEINRPGDSFVAVLQQPVVSDGWVVARAGQAVMGRVVDADRAGRNGASYLALELTELVLVDGQQLPVRTQLIDSQGEPARVHDVGLIAAGAGMGTAVGAVAGGGRGAAIGAAIGTAVAVAGVMSTRGQPTEVPEATLLTFRLDAPLAVSTARSEQAFLAVTAADYSEGLNYQRPEVTTVAHRDGRYDYRRYRSWGGYYPRYPRYPVRVWPPYLFAPAPRVYVAPPRVYVAPRIYVGPRGGGRGYGWGRDRDRGHDRGRDWDRGRDRGRDRDRDRRRH